MPEEDQGSTGAEEQEHLEAGAREGAEAEGEAGAEAQKGEGAEAEGEAGAQSGGAERVEFTPAQQAVFEKRLGKEIEKTRKAGERSAELEGTAETLKKEVAGLKAQVEAGLALHPDWVAPEDLETIRKANALEKEIGELEAHWDGVEDEDPGKALKPAEVHKLHARMAGELAAIKARADGAYQGALKQFVEDAREGRKLREAKAAAALKAKAAKPAAEAGPTLGREGAAKPGAERKIEGQGLKREKLPPLRTRTVLDVVAAM